ncbi:hypothetical protein BS049_RS23300 [Vibrio parahaemolyticus]|nr:hypothetical protein [Vibrio parahaemolyticus]
MKKTLGAACCAWLLCSASFAATVTGKISGDELRWLSGRDDGEMLGSLAFDHVGSLPPTAQWVPGTFAMSTEVLTLTSSTGGKVSVPAQLVGATYSVASGFTPDTVPPTAPICAESILSAQTTVMSRDGSFCIAGKSARYESATVPFEQYRPILKLERDALIDAFKTAPSGMYSGMVTGTLRYGFYVPGSGALSYRNIPVTFSVQLRNTGSRLSSVLVLGNGHITPTYDTYKHTAKGTTGYKVTAHGEFETGVRFRFVSKDANDYTLKPAGALGDAVEYNVSCPLCLPESSLVEEGILREPERWNRVEQSGKTVSFDLKISYDGVSADKIVDARYQDSFTLMLEVIL